MRIGNIEIKGKVFCAPMAGVTNRAFRKKIHSLGAAITYTEMTSNVGLKYNKDKTLSYASIGTDEGDVGLQIFGGEIDDYINAAMFYDENSKASFIDINMGCPVKKVAIKSKAGSSLLKDPAKIEEIIKGIVEKINKPLTIKIRLGWDENDLTYLEVAKRAERAGAAAIAIHGRTAKEMYSGNANWKSIKEIKESVNIPVIGNGDIRTPEDAKRMIDETGVDAVMIGRAARENPWLISQINDYLETGKYDELPNLAKVVDELFLYHKDLIEIFGEKKAFLELKGISVQWLKRFSELKQVRHKLVQTNSYEEIKKMLLDIKEM